MAKCKYARIYIEIENIGFNQKFIDMVKVIQKSLVNNSLIIMVNNNSIIENYLIDNDKVIKL